MIKYYYLLLNQRITTKYYFIAVVHDINHHILGIGFDFRSQVFNIIQQRLLQNLIETTLLSDSITINSIVVVTLQ